jgi:hypothetical protein
MVLAAGPGAACLIKDIVTFSAVVIILENYKAGPPQ